MITIQQIKAARSLLDMSQGDLASAAGLSQTSLSAIERGAKMPRTGSLSALQQVLEENGGEFLDGMCVRLREHVFNIKVHDKSEPASLEYHQDILDTLGKTANPVFQAVSHSDTYIKPKLRRVQFMYFKQMIKLGFKEKIVLPETETMFYGPKEVSEYRVLKPELFGEMEMAVFGHKFSINESNRVVIVESEVISDAFRRQIEFYWRMAKPIPEGTPRVFDQDLEKWG